MIYKRTVVALVVAVLMADGVYAQRRGMGGYYGIRRPEPNSFTGSFTFCRIAFRAAYSGYGGGWGVDYPRADQNLPIRMSELTKAAANFDESGSPHYLMIQATEPELLRCPFVAVTNHGRAFFSPEEAAALRIPQIPNIGFYQGTGMTSERGMDSAQARAVAILDARGRVMVLTTHNTDFGDAYEREATIRRISTSFPWKGMRWELMCCCMHDALIVDRPSSIVGTKEPGTAKNPAPRT